MDIFYFRARRVVNTAGVFDSTPMSAGSDVSVLFMRFQQKFIPNGT